MADNRPTLRHRFRRVAESFGVAVIVFFVVYVVADNYLPSVGRSTRGQRVTHTLTAGGIAVVVALVLALAWAIATGWREDRDIAQSELDALKIDMASLREEVRQRDEREDVQLDVTAPIVPERVGFGEDKLILNVLNKGASSSFIAEVISEVRGAWVPIERFGPGVDIAWEGRPEDTRRISQNTPDYLFLALYNRERRSLRLIGPASVYTQPNEQQRSAELRLIEPLVSFWIAITDTEVNVARRFFVAIQVGPGDSVPIVLVWPESRTPEFAEALP